MPADTPTQHPAHHSEPTRSERAASTIAERLGSVRFILAQTIIILCWIALNIAAVGLRWDPYPFILLNLAFSTQAAYAAPLILLAQKRQSDLDHARADHDHQALGENTSMTREIHRHLGIGGDQS